MLNLKINSFKIPKSAFNDIELNFKGAADFLEIQN